MSVSFPSSPSSPSYPSSPSSAHTHASHRVIALNASGELSLEWRPTPAPSAGEVLVQVKAFGVNRADLLQRAGHYPPPPGVDPTILGLEFAGEVMEGSALWPVGSQVMGICAGEAYSERVVAHERALMPVPPQLSWEEAAALPEAYLTALDALERAELKAGERLLVHAIGSGVGGAVAHIGAYLGAEVVGTTRSPWKQAWALEHLPVSVALTLESGDFSPLTSYAPEGFDVVVDFVGAAYLKQNIKALRSRGRLVVVGLLGGVTGELPLGLLLARRASVYGTVLRSRPLEEKVALTQEATRRLIPALERGVLAPPVVREVFEASPQGVSAAHSLMASGASCAKLVCVW